VWVKAPARLRWQQCHSFPSRALIGSCASRVAPRRRATHPPREHQRSGREQRCYAGGAEKEHGEAKQGPQRAHQRRYRQR
jgi:hypothetical protein